MWDKHDIVTVGPNCSTEQWRTSKLLNLAMAAVRACKKLSVGFETGCEKLIALTELAATVPDDIGPSAARNLRNEDNVAREGLVPPLAPLVDNEIEISATAPRKAQTKGSRKRTGAAIDIGDGQMRATGGVRTCSSCNLKGHYSTTCPLNPENARRGRGSGRGRRGMMGGRRGRPRIVRKLQKEFDYAAGDKHDD